MSNSCGTVWGEIAPSEHLVQIYQEDGAVLDSLESYVIGGLRSGDGVVVVATANHIVDLENRLQAQDIDLASARRSNQFIALDAEECLYKFMVGDWPDTALFDQLVMSVLNRAGQGGRRVRVFGEMVAVLWAQGFSGATIRLEQLWEQACRRESFSLLCAYPRAGFTNDAQESIREICAAHSKVLA